MPHIRVELTVSWETLSVGKAHVDQSSDRGIHALVAACLCWSAIAAGQTYAAAKAYGDEDAYQIYSLLGLTQGLDVVVRRWNVVLSLFLALSFDVLFCGFRFGMPAGITVIIETWRSPVLGILLLTTEHDSDGRESRTAVTRLDLGGPDLAKFEPPQNYKVIRSK
jgi:hypothetical protein